MFEFMYAELMKRKRTSVFAAHVGIPMISAVLFLVYYMNSPWDINQKISAYYEVLGMGLPVLIGIFCAQCVEQEQTAGGFQNMRMLTNKRKAFIAQLFVLLFLAFCAIVFASVIFGAGLTVLSKNQMIGFSCYLMMGIVLWVCSIPLYIWHMFLAYRFSKGVTASLGIVDGLICALFLTGMGDVYWKYVPASFPGRVPFMYFEGYLGMENVMHILKGMIPRYAVMTMVAFSIYVVWVTKWEGIKVEE